MDERTGSISTLSADLLSWTCFSGFAKHAELDMSWSMQERYKLLYLTAPAVDEMESSIKTLREVIAAHKESIAEKEAEIVCNNPPIFRTLQVTAMPRAVGRSFRSSHPLPTPEESARRSRHRCLLQKPFSIPHGIC